MDSLRLDDLLRAELEARWGAAGLPAPGTLAAGIAGAWQRARAAFPEIDLDAAAFVAHVAVHLPRSNAEAALAALHAEDLYLALACANGNDSALTRFEREHAEDLRLAVLRVRGSAPGADDVGQALREKLFVGTNQSRPKILDYSGQGRLKSWFRVAVVRALLDERRRRNARPAPSDDEFVLGLAAPERDPELEYLRRLYSHEFRVAFEAAAAALRPEDRNALRAHYVSRLTVDQIAAMLGLHRASAARRVSTARERLMAETRRRLAARLQLSRGELESVMRMIQSGLHVSLHRLLV